MNASAAWNDHDLLESAALLPGAMIAARAGPWHVLLARTDDGSLHAMNDRCPHAASRLSGGLLRKGQVMCPLHGARFDAVSGRCIGGAYNSVRVFPVRLEGGRIIVSVPSQAPELSEVPLA
jgi:nitrite reductase/ring-hydroxylating ferredoxin subunit